MNIEKWFKNIVLYIKLLFITRKEEILPKKNDIIVSTGSDILDPTKISDILSGGVHKEQKWFTRANNLIEEFAGDAPIVYEPNLDTPTIVKQNQYGYLRELTLEEKELENQELLSDDIDLDTDIDKSIFGAGTKTISTVDYLNDKAKFDDRWEDIKRQARLDKSENEIDEESEYIDAVIKE